MPPAEVYPVGDPLRAILLKSAVTAWVYAADPMALLSTPALTASALTVKLELITNGVTD